MTLHLLLHAVVPLAVARLMAPATLWRAYLTMMAAMVIDADHLLASPVYDPGRCSVGFHPLHGLLPIAVYAVMMLPVRTRWLGVGLVLHVVLDALDCRLTSGVWYVH